MIMNQINGTCIFKLEKSESSLWYGEISKCRLLDNWAAAEEIKSIMLSVEKSTTKSGVISTPIFCW